MTPRRRAELRAQAEQAGAALVVVPAHDVLDLLDTVERLSADLRRGFDEFAELREQDR